MKREAEKITSNVNISANDAFIITLNLSSFVPLNPSTDSILTRSFVSILFLTSSVSLGHKSINFKYVINNGCFVGNVVKMTENEKKQLVTEVNVLKQLNHPTID